MATQTKSRERVYFGEYELDCRSGELRRNGTLLKLQPQPAKILAILVGRAGEVVTRQELAQQVWGSETYVDFEHGLNYAVGQIRGVLEDDAEQPRFLETVPKRGYRFIATVEGTSPPPASTHTGGVWPSTRSTLLFGAAAVLIALGLLKFGRGREGAVDSRRAGTGTKSVAVLPFENVPNDTSNEYLSDGISNSIRYRLSGVSDLKVTSSGSVLQYKGKRTPPRTVGQDLKVEAVVTGSLTKREDEISIQVELVNAADNSLLWGQQYNSKLAEILHIQDEISKTIADKLLPVNGGQAKSLSRQYTDNAEAYEAYLRGTYQATRFTSMGLTKAVEQFQTAVSLDPRFAAAYAQLGTAYWMLTQPLGALPVTEGMSKAKEAAQRALAIDSNLAAAHSALGLVECWYDFDWASAEREFKRALDLDQNDAWAHLGYAFLLTALGRHGEAIAEGKRAVEVAPLDFTIRIGLAEQYNLARQFEESLDECKTIAELDPNFSRAYEDMGVAYEYLGRYPEAVAAYEKSMTLSGKDRSKIETLHRTFRRGGIKAVRRLWLTSVETDQSYIGITAVYALTGDRDRALASLQRAFETRSGDVIFIKVDPGLDNIRSDPRYSDLLRRMGLSQ